ncbi:MAG: hypothetical protein K1X92_08345 [Bacteroidia bacterium]|nr:hypothetical protein [Bacteroidia bacterium]
MKKLIASIPLLMLFVLSGYSQTTPIETDWKELFKNEDAANLRAARTTAYKILQKAKEQNKTQDWVNAVFYIMKYQGAIEEAATVDSLNIDFLKEEIGKANFPVNAILQNTLANTYNDILNRQYWIINNINENNTPMSDNYHTWDLKRFYKEITGLYVNSISNKNGLKGLSVVEYSGILLQNPESKALSFQYRPTIYDVMTHHALEFFQNDRISPDPVPSPFVLKPEAALSDIRTYLTTNFTTPDTSAAHKIATDIYQNLLNLHISRKDTFALILADLERLDFGRSVAPYGSKSADSLYIASLQKLAKLNNEHPAVTDVYSFMAKFYANRGLNYMYSDNKNDSLYFQDFIKANRICEEAIKRYPTSHGAMVCKQIQQDLSAKSMDLSFPEVNPSMTPIPVLVRQRNAGQIWFRLYPFNATTASVKPEGFAKLTAVQSWDETFESSDYRYHTKEIKIPAISEGEYWLAMSDNAGFNAKTGTVQAVHFYVNDIAFYYVDDPMYYKLYFADRKTGKPLDGMQAVRYYFPDEKAIDFVQDSTYSTDSKGHFDFVKPLYSGDSYLRYMFAFRNGTETMANTLTISESDYVSWNLVSDMNLTPDKKKKNTPKKEEVKPVPIDSGPVIMELDEKIDPYTYDYGGEILEQGVLMFSDRKIYRPGQTVYIKAIPYNRGSNTFIPIKEDTFRITYGEKLAEHTLITNRYGSFSDSLILPKTSSGEIEVIVEWIQNNQPSRKYFGRLILKIEEYKRPKFWVETLPVKNEVEIGDSVTLRGKAIYYAGVPLRGAKVEVKVEYRHYTGNYWESNNLISSFNKVTETDLKGEFNVIVPPVKTDSLKNLTSLYILMTAKVSEASGEFYELDQTVVLTKESVRPYASFPEFMNKSGLKPVELHINNVDNQNVPRGGTLAFYLIPADKDFYGVDIKSLSKTGEMPFSAADTVNFIPTVLSTQQVGRYYYTMNVVDKTGDTATFNGSFTLWDSTSNESPFTTTLWSHIANPEIIAGNTLTHYLYSQNEMLYLNYLVVKDKRVVYSTLKEIRGGKNIVEVPVDGSWEGNYQIVMVTIKNNQYLTFEDNFTVKSENHKLKVKWMSFRNKLVPGAREEWKLNVTALNGGSPVSAELLALMYDKSLDAIFYNSWYVPSFSNQNSNPYRYYYNPVVSQGSGFDVISPSFYFINRTPRVPNADISFAELNYYAQKQKAAGFKPKSGKKGEAPEASMAVMDSMGQSKDSGTGYAAFAVSPDTQKLVSEESDADGIPDLADKEPDTPEGAKQDAKSTVSGQAVEMKKEKFVRTNLKETAFFLPHLETNAEGDVLVNFTSPEALTQWKFAAFAHTEDGKSGEITSSDIFTQKPMMILPNNPRFVRMGDNMKFAATVINQTGKELTGKAQIQFTDIISGQDVTAKMLNGGSPEVTFSAPMNQNASLTWSISVPKDVSALTYRVIAQSGEFADGEENALPVLTDDVLITESLPLYVKSKETKTFIMPGLRESFSMNRGIRNSLFTMEFSENPAWYALQSMPYLMEFPHECSEQLFSRYYANAISNHVLNSTPAVKSVLEKWTKSSENKEGILDMLSKNEELKSAMLEETPWILNAKQDDWKKRIGTLMDMERMASEMDKAEKTLWDRQNSDGSFSWFPGGGASNYITRLLLEGFGHLNKLGVKASETVKEKMEKAVRYSDDEIQKVYKDAKKEDRKEEYIASISDIQALYTRSFYPEVKMSEPEEKAYTFFAESAVKNIGKYTPFGQAMLALALHRRGETARAKTILDALKNSAVRDKEDGVSWNEKGGYFWYESAVETQALVAEAFDEIYDDQEIVNQVKNWMLRKKRNRSWETTTATVAACNLLFLTGENMLESSNQTDYKFGGQFFSPSDKGVEEDGTGYVKVSWKPEEIKPEMAEWTITKNSIGNGYGALYWQYFQPIYAVSNATSGLSLKKTYYVERYGNKMPVSDGMSLQAGDKIFVKLEFSTGRDMEYVHLKDLRAGCFEPVEQISTYKSNGKIGYYQSNRDVATHFFIDNLPKGDHIIEYELKTYYKGSFSSGIATIQSMYAPEFNAHTSGGMIRVE